MFRSALHWLQVRTRRHLFLLSSPLPVATVVDRLNQNLTKETNFSRGYIGKVGPFAEGPQSWPVRLSFRGSVHSSWRYIFIGTIYADETGTELAGTLGPIDFVYGFSLVWLGGVTLFFVFGFIGLVSDVATGQGWAYLPLVLVPLAMMAAFVVMTKFATRSALSEWDRMLKWLTELLDLRGGSQP